MDTARQLSLATVLLVSAATAQADIFSFIAMPMSGSQESPPVATAGYGSFTGLYDNTTRTLTFDTSWQLQSGSTVSVSHFHGPAALGASAGILIPVEVPAGASAGRQAGTVTLTAEQEAMLLAGTMYFNVHSDVYPNGELRAQLIENSQTAFGDRFFADTGILVLPSVVAPGLGVFGGQMQLVPQSDPPQFTVTNVAPIR